MKILASSASQFLKNYDRNKKFAGLMAPCVRGVMNQRCAVSEHSAFRSTSSLPLMVFSRLNLSFNGTLSHIHSNRNFYTPTLSVQTLTSLWNCQSCVMKIIRKLSEFYVTLMKICLDACRKTFNFPIPVKFYPIKRDIFRYNSQTWQIN